MIFHISGHLDVTEAEFAQHYIPNIDAALADPEVRFVIGDAHGADWKAQLYLRDVLAGDEHKRQRGRVVIYHMFTTPRRHEHADFPTRGGYESDDERDAAMTRDSDADIAWVRPGRENSGTAKNIARRKT